MPPTRSHVLIVDDDPTVREVVHAVLDDDDCWITEASDGFEALRMVEAASPDVVVLDVMMPGMTGFEVCRRIRQNPHTASSTVVILTALDSLDSRDEGDESGADAFLTKPFSALDLLGVIAQARSRARH